MEIQEIASISRISRDDWDSVAGSEILSSHGWLTLIEQSTSEKIGFLYFVVRDSGKIVGAVSCQTYFGVESAALDRLLYGSAARAARAAGMRATPALVVGSRFGLAEPFLLDASLPVLQRNRVSRQLVDALVAASEREGATIIVRNASSNVAAGALEKAGFRSTPEMPTAYIDIDWETFADFRSSLRKIHPATEKAIRHQGNRAKRAGIEVETISDAGLVTPEMHELLDSHYRRLNGVPLPFGASFLPLALNQLGGKAILAIARQDARLLGVNFGLRDATSLRTMMIGIDQDMGRRTAVYYLLSNGTIARAITAGAPRVYFGRMLYDVKLRRGCSLARTTMWIRGRSSLQRRMLRYFIGLRTRKLNRMIDAYEPLSAANAAGLRRNTG